MKVSADEEVAIAFGIRYGSLVLERSGSSTLVPPIRTSIDLKSGVHAFQSRHFLGAFAPSPTPPAQIDFSRIYGPEDHDVAVPQSVLPLGKKDAVALQAIVDFLKTINGANWSGMQGSGTFLYARDETGSPATLTVQNGNAYRLDVNAAKGQLSIRLQDGLGQILESDGKKHTLPPATAKGGLLAFPKLMSTSFPDSQTSVLDQGTITIDGKNLHRITIQEPVFKGEAPQASDQLSAIDLYFDPTTHLLIKSVASVQLSTTDPARYVQAMTYSDYREVNKVLLPFFCIQTLNGQRQWALQLSGVQLNPSVDTSYFQF